MNYFCVVNQIIKILYNLLTTYPNKNQIEKNRRKTVLQKHITKNPMEKCRFLLFIQQSKLFQKIVNYLLIIREDTHKNEISIKKIYVMKLENEY